MVFIQFVFGVVVFDLEVRFFLARAQVDQQLFHFDFLLLQVPLEPDVLVARTVVQQVVLENLVRVRDLQNQFVQHRRPVQLKRFLLLVFGVHVRRQRRNGFDCFDFQVIFFVLKIR